MFGLDHVDTGQAELPTDRAVEVVRILRLLADHVERVSAIDNGSQSIIIRDHNAQRVGVMDVFGGIGQMLKNAKPLDEGYLPLPSSLPPTTGEQS
jgi:hypothetical protein